MRYKVSVNLPGTVYVDASSASEAKKIAEGIVSNHVEWNPSVSAFSVELVREEEDDARS